MKLLAVVILGIVGVVILFLWFCGAFDTPPEKR